MLINNTKKISLNIIPFVLIMLFMFANNHIYFMVVRYYALPIITIVFTIIVLVVGKININRYVICGFFLLLIEMINIYRARQNLELETMFSYLLWTCLFICMMMANYSVDDIKFVIRVYILSAVIIATIVIFQRYNYRLTTDIRYTIQVGTNTKIDPNYLAAFIFPASAYALKAFLSKKNSIWNLSASIVIAVAVFMTGSRGGVFALFIAWGFIIIHFLFSEKKLNKKIYVMIGIICVAVVGLIIVIYFVPMTNNYLNRFFNLMDSGNAKRISYWEYGWQAFLEQPVLGYGFLGDREIIMNIVNQNNVSHNTYVSLLLQLGVLGAIPFVCIIINLCRTLLKYNGVYLFGILLAVLFNSLMINAMTTVSLWINIIILCMMCRSNKKDNFYEEFI